MGKNKAEHCAREAPVLQFYAVRPPGGETYVFVVEAANERQALIRALVAEPMVSGTSSADKHDAWAILETEPPFTLPIFRDSFFRKKTYAHGTNQSTDTRH